VWAGVKATRDAELRLNCFQAYNDWMAEFQAVDLYRLVGVGLVPTTGIDDAVAELRRCRDLGLRTVALESYPSGSWTDASPEDDRFWRAAEEMGMPISLHATFTFPPNSTQLFAQGDASLTALAARGSYERVLERLIVTGVFDRFPTLRFVGAEVNCGWLPYYLEQFDRSYRRHGRELGLRLELLPSEYFRRNSLITFIVDPLGVQARHLIGVDNLMWCSDFPHSVSNWPIDVEIAHAQMVDVDQSEIDRMMWRTCADLYGLEYDEHDDAPAAGAGTEKAEVA